MRCPYCQHQEDKVVDSRSSKMGDAIRRRRECLKCGRRYTTYEQVLEVLLTVVKKDGRREAFERGKIMNGLRKACEKRPVSLATLEAMIDELERELQKEYDKEVPASAIGEKIMEKLYGIDEVAYVRFASVYRQFKDIHAFTDMLKKLKAEAQ
jgi:transcriptional repressor NrdR